MEHRDPHLSEAGQPPPPRHAGSSGTTCQGGAGHGDTPHHHQQDHGRPHGHAHAGHPHGPGGHSHVPARIQHERPLWWALGLTSTVMLAEIVGAWLTGSLALLSDAAHMATDTLALAIALVAVRLSRRPPDARRTYGYARFEALGALANGGLLFLLAGYILWEAWHRFRAPVPVATLGMLGVAVIGLACNLAAMKLLHAGAGQSLNLKGAYLEVWSDMLGSVAVIVAALVIHLTGWRWVDPLLAVLIGLWVLPRTWLLVREALNVLMEGVPSGVELPRLRGDILAHPGVARLHDLHVWALASRSPALSAHVVVAPGTDGDALRRALAKMLAVRHHVDHVTLQMEADGVDDCAGCDHP